MKSRFTPRVDVKNRLVVTRFNSSCSQNPHWCYQIWRINLKGTIDKRFKPLFSFTDGDFSQIKEFQHSGTGERVKVVKSRFKPVFGLKQKNSPQSIWEVATT